MARRTRLASFVPAVLVTLAAPGFPQESRAVLDAPLVAFPGDARVEHLVDLDQDGWIDALSWWYGSSSLQTVQARGWLNDHAGGFAQAWQVTIGPGPGPGAPGHLAAGDVDGDGRSDFALEFRRNLVVFTTAGANAPTPAWQATLPRDVEELALVDWSGDGLADLVWRTDEDHVHVHRNEGAAQGFAQLELDTAGVGAPRSSMRLGELTGDGVPDVLFVYAQEVRVYPLGLDGQVGAPILYPSDSTWIVPRPAIGDLDGDQDLDLVVFDGTGPTGGFYELWRRAGRGALVHEAPRAGGPTTELADLDLDGDLDGICCGGGPSGGTWLNAVKSTFNVCFNLDGRGSFSPAFQMRGVGSTHVAGAADVDHDGDVDLVAGRVVYYARGAMTASHVAPIPGPLASPESVVDHDSDGDPDVALGAGLVAESDGRDGFATVAPALPAPPAGSVWHGPGYRGDFDGDGDLDLLVARSGPGGFAAMHRLANLGGGAYVDAGPAGDPGVSFSLTGDADLVTRGGLVADLDGDGDQDLVTRAVFPASNAATRAWVNDGSGSFQLAWSDTVYSAVALGDSDGDDLPDAILAPQFGSTARPVWRRGLGDGTFGPPVILPGNEYMRFDPRQDELAFADLDGDGDRDVLAVSHNQNFAGEVYFWRNQGTTASSWVQSYVGGMNHETVYPGPLWVAVGDVNGDGWDDVTTWPPREARAACYVLLRTPDGTGFEAPFLQAVQPLALVDVDSDGDADAIERAWTDTSNALAPSAAILAGAGSRHQYGEGFPGSDGLAPKLGAVGPFRVGEPVELRLRGGLGGSKAFVAIGRAASELQDVPFAGMTAYAWPPVRRIPVTLSGPAGVAGVGAATVSWTVTPDLAGVTLYHQAYVIDPQGSGGLSCSNGLELAFD